MNSERREFIKQLTVFSLIFGVNPLNVLSANKIKPAKAVIQIVDDTKKKFNEGLKSIYNVKVSQGLEDATLRKELRKNLEFAGHSIENPTIFANGNVLPTGTKSLPLKKIWDLFNDARLKKLKSYEFFFENIVGGVANRFRGNPKVDEAFDAIAFGYYIGKTTGYGVGCATTVFSLNPLSLPVCYKFFSSATETIDQYEKLQGSRARNKANQVSSLQSAVSELSQHLSTNYSNTADWKFDVISSPIKIDNSSVNVRSIVGSSNNSQLDNLIIDHLTKDTVFPNLEEMNSFFSEFQDGLGNLFKESVQRTVETEAQLDQKKQIEERERNLLYNSIGQLAGVLANKVMGEKEAKLFNALLPVGMQLAVGAAMGPMGWAALGMSVASTLMSNSQDNPNVAIFKALAQIQKQLNVIIQGIEQIQKTQIEILKGIDEILKNVQELKEIQMLGVNRILTELNNLTIRIDVSQLQPFNNKIKSDFQNIYFIIAKDSIIVSQENTKLQLDNSFESLVKAVQFELDDVLFTRFDDKADRINASKFKNEILGSRFSDPVSLYDTIGLISGLKDYSVREDNLTVRNTKAISHPQSFYKITGEIIDWLVMSKDKVGIDRKKEFCQRLLTTAESSKENINETCDKPTIERKITDYSTTMEKALIELHKSFESQHYEEFGKFEGKDNYRKHCRLNSIGKNYIKGENATFDFDRAKITIPGKDRAFDNFYGTDKYDDVLLNLSRDLNIVTKTKHQAYRPQNRNQRKNGFQMILVSKDSMEKGKEVGRKRNRITLKHPEFPSLEFEFDYAMFLMADKITEYCRMVSFNLPNTPEVPPQLSCNYNLVTATLNSGFNEVDWKSVVRKRLKDANIDFNTQFPKHESMTFYDFLNSLIERKFVLMKNEFIAKGLKKIEDKDFEKIDGCGISLMVLSKLNQVVTSDYLVPYDVDYGDEIFTQEDFKGALEYYASQEYGTYSVYNEVTKEKDKNLFQEILKEYEETKKNRPPNKQESIFYLIGETETPLNPNLFIDLMCILMKRRVLKTISNCKAKTRKIKENDCEPYLADTINMLRLFQDEYLNASV